MSWVNVSLLSLVKSVLKTQGEKWQMANTVFRLERLGPIKEKVAAERCTITPDQCKVSKVGYICGYRGWSVALARAGYSFTCLLAKVRAARIHRRFPHCPDRQVVFAERQAWSSQLITDAQSAAASFSAIEVVQTKRGIFSRWLSARSNKKASAGILVSLDYELVVDVFKEPWGFRLNIYLSKPWCSG